MLLWGWLSDQSSHHHSQRRRKDKRIRNHSNVHYRAGIKCSKLPMAGTARSSISITWWISPLLYLIFKNLNKLDPFLRFKVQGISTDMRNLITLCFQILYQSGNKSINQYLGVGSRNNPNTQNFVSKWLKDETHLGALYERGSSLSETLTNGQGLRGHRKRDLGTGLTVMQL